jgi:hypothetical protein
VKWVGVYGVVDFQVGVLKNIEDEIVWMENKARQYLEDRNTALVRTFHVILDGMSSDESTLESKSSGR